MRQSHLFTKTRKELPKGEVSKNAQLLIQAGFVHKEIAGVYTYLPLGLRVLENMKAIIREELDAVGCQEVSMTALQPKERWEATNRWDDAVVDNWFKTKLASGVELGLAFTHEEPMTEMMRSFISSYKDLPKLVYQFQTKFRNELRAKSGVMRGREFLMKDLYSFHTTEEAHLKFYDEMKEVYQRIFDRLGIGEQTYLTLSSGGSFSKYSYEFQTISEAGEDIILLDKEKGLSINKDDFSDEIFADFGLNKEDYNFEEYPSIEVGDIYTLRTKYADALNLKYANQEGDDTPVFMGSYGIGVTRLLGTIVEVMHDEHGMIWPEQVAPYKVHLLRLSDDESVVGMADELYTSLKEAGIEVLYDDTDARAGAKFGSADLIGLPYRLVIGKKSLDEKLVEVKRRDSEEVEMIPMHNVIDYIS
jgi:prolyl-tRNA synthetase